MNNIINTLFRAMTYDLYRFMKRKLQKKDNRNYRS